MPAPRRVALALILATASLSHGAAMGASGEAPPADLGTFTETLPVIRADVPRTPFRTGAFASHWEADRLAQSASEDDLSGSNPKPPADGSSHTTLPRLEPVKSGSSVDATPTWRTAQATRLTNVLQAYALRDPHVGYCQGMNEIGKFIFNYRMGNCTDVVFC